MQVVCKIINVDGSKSVHIALTNDELDFIRESLQITLNESYKQQEIDKAKELMYCISTALSEGH